MPRRRWLNNNELIELVIDYDQLDDQQHDEHNIYFTTMRRRMFLAMVGVHVDVDVLLLHL